MANNIDYKKLSTQLDEILAKLQGEDLDIDQALELYEKGMAITSDLQAYLKQAENKVSKIKSSIN